MNAMGLASAMWTLALSTVRTDRYGQVVFSANDVIDAKPEW